MTRAGAAARKPTGKTVPRLMGTSPKISPASRTPTTRSTPSARCTGSIPPPSTAETAGPREERRLASLRRRVLARAETDVRGGARQPLALGVVQSGEERDQPDLLGGDHRGKTLTRRRGEENRLDGDLGPIERIRVRPGPALLAAIEARDLLHRVVVELE